MTLIIGVLCSDGVVIGADSAATFGSADGTQTIWQATDEKVRIVEDRALFASAGPVGLGQVNAESLRVALLNPALKIQSGTPTAAATLMADHVFRPNVGKIIVATAPAVPIVGNAAASAKISSGFLVALSAGGGPRLYEFEWNGSPEEKTAATPFVAIGSGQGLADPFLAFFKEIFWGGQPPTLNDATFAAVWTLEQAIDFAPGGLAKPIHVYWLARDGGVFRPRKLEDSELDEHRQAVVDAKAALRAFRDSPPEAPPPPPPPA